MRIKIFSALQGKISYFRVVNMLMAVIVASINNTDNNTDVIILTIVRPWRINRVTRYANMLIPSKITKTDVTILAEPTALTSSIASVIARTQRPIIAILLICNIPPFQRTLFLLSFPCTSSATSGQIKFFLVFNLWRYNRQYRYLTLSWYLPLNAPHQWSLGMCKLAPE